MIWSDEIRGVAGNFFGLIDDRQRTVQFLYEASIPDGVDDASRLRIVLIDFPDPQRKGSYARSVTLGEVPDLIKLAFEAGADRQHFGDLTFTAW